MRSSCSTVVISAWLVVSCAASGEAAPKPALPEPAPSELTAAPKVTPAPAEPKVTQQSDAAPAAEVAEPSPASKPVADPNATREVVYTVLPEGLKISVGGVKFKITSSATQITQGFGVKLNVAASAADGKAHSLSSPKTGPLAFAGSVQRKGQSEPERFGDERSGDGEASVFGDDVTRFSRSWPAKGTRVLGSGDSLDLEVALWGLGTEKEDRRPVKRFCHVRMTVGKGKPRVIVEPPAGVSGQ